MVDDASNIKVVMSQAHAANAYFLTNNGEEKKYNTPPGDIFFYPNAIVLFEVLDSGEVDAILYGKGDASSQS